MTTTEFRQYLRQEGEQLLLPVHPLELTERAAQFIADSRSETAHGFTPDDLWIEPVLGQPIPLYNVGADGELLPWTGIAPSLLWHPLLWLPKRVALPARFEHPDGSVEVETLTEWSIRVMLECMTVGLWDLQKGWADVWTICGIDAAADSFDDRVTAWLDGGTDQELESVSLESIFDDASSASSSYRRARVLASTVVPVAVGRHARDLASDSDPVEELHDADAVRAAAVVLGGISMVSLVGDSDVFEQAADLYVRALEGDDDPLEVLQALQALLRTTADDYEPIVEAAREALAA